MHDIDARDCVAFTDPVDRIHAVDHLVEHSVLASEAQIAFAADEPLTVTGVMAASAHADSAASMRQCAELVTEELWKFNVLGGAGPPP